MVKSKKKNSEPGCFATLFGYVILACIIALVVDLINSKISNKMKNNIKIVSIIVAIAIFAYLIFSIYRKFNKKYSMQQLDTMEGHQFEYACAEILKANGFKSVKVTQGSGDYGVDILAQKGGIKYAIQCKCYSHKLDNTPIQEVIGGLAYYGCTKGVVMTNQYFTEPAKRLATVNGVELWDRDALMSMLSKTRKRYSKPQNEQGDNL